MYAVMPRLVSSDDAMKKGRSEGRILSMQISKPVLTPDAAASGNTMSDMNAHSAAVTGASLFIVSNYALRHRFIRTKGALR